MNLYKYFFYILPTLSFSLLVVRVNVDNNDNFRLNYNSRYINCSTFHFTLLFFSHPRVGNLDGHNYYALNLKLIEIKIKIIVENLSGF